MELTTIIGGIFLDSLLYFSNSTSNFMFTGVPIFIAIIFVLVFIGIIFSVFRGVTTWSSNNKSPREQEQVFVLTKRTETRHMGGNQHSRSTTYYYVTFEFPNETRKEFEVKGNEYGLIAEGDMGILDYQGTRFHSFDRETNSSEQTH